jgi:hypothetical protein
MCTQELLANYRVHKKYFWRFTVYTKIVFELMCTQEIGEFALKFAKKGCF